MAQARFDSRYGTTFPTVTSVGKRLECGMHLVEGGTCGRRPTRIVMAIPCNSANPESGTALKITMLCGDHAPPYKPTVTDIVICDGCCPERSI